MPFQLWIINLGSRKFFFQRLKENKRLAIFLKIRRNSRIRSSDRKSRVLAGEGIARCFGTSKCDFIISAATSTADGGLGMAVTIANATALMKSTPRADTGKDTELMYTSLRNLLIQSNFTNLSKYFCLLS